ncbi:AraC family transcriptional regulator [Maridesulfovibrio zosterae]|uniref:AraC family transcriptional regulator n=1 Tax=Maridesulfovibrio zosterae TaxID=82171 RepID=UPI0004028A65|nr:helix-turn-helix transcriptional regulator [Maridesulfovibrio zosterae]
MPKKSVNRDDYQHVSNPFSAMANEFPSGHVIAEHSHYRAQLLFAEQGIMETYARQRCWFIPPQRALWLPSYEPHSMRTHGRVALRTIFIDPAACRDDSPNSPQAVRISPLLRELLVRSALIAIDYDKEGRDGLIMNLINEEIDWSEPDLFSLSWPMDERLLHVCQHLKTYPDDCRTLEEWGSEIGVSNRTLSRLFRLETGISFSEWRQQSRILAALPMLLSGMSVLEASLAVGYETPSAFSAMFRRLIGKAPREFLQS